MITSSKVRALCTTDDPADDLQYHKLLAEDKDFATQVLPTFRPDKILHVENDEYPVYLQKLGAAAGVPSSSGWTTSPAAAAACPTSPSAPRTSPSGTRKPPKRP